MHPRFLFNLWVTLSAASTLFAASDMDIINALSMEEMLELSISTSTGNDKPLMLAPAIATVITEKQIALSGARTLNEILERVPGLHTYETSISLANSVDVRGIHTKYNSQIMVLMNGTSIQAMKFGRPIPGIFIPLSAVKRIEIVRGPGSVVYGANAFSGVINIITKDAEYLEQNSEAGMRYGSFQSGETWLNYGLKEESFSFGLNASYMSSNGDRERVMEVDAQTLIDTLFGTNASLAPGSLETGYEQFNVNANLVAGDFEANIWASILENGGTGQGIAEALDPSGRNEYVRVQSDLYYHYRINETMKIEHKLSLSYQKLQTYLNVFPAGVQLPIGIDGNFGGTPVAGFVTFSDGYIGTPGDVEKTIGYEGTLTANYFDNHQLRLSGGAWYGSYRPNESKNFGPGVIDGTVSPIDGTLTDVTGTADIYMPDVNRKIFFLSMQDEWAFAPGFELTAGVRYDHFSDFGSTINPRLALVWQTNSVLTSKLLYGRAFRAPSLNDLYSQNNPVAYGNRDLDAEKIDTVELSFNYFPNAALRSSIGFYYFKANDLIDSVGATLDNVGRLYGKGVEIEFDYRFNELMELYGDYAYRYTRIGSSSTPAPDAPKQLGHLGLNWKPAAKWAFHSELFWVADRARAVVDTRPETFDYVTVNAGMNYLVSPKTTFSLNLRNLFDRTYYEPSPYSVLGELDDYKMPGRYLFAEIRYKF